LPTPKALITKSQPTPTPNALVTKSQPTPTPTPSP
jgi:hypothetical protein